MNGKRILLIIGGGIAAYKCLELIRALRDAGAGVRVIMTKAAAEFVTPLSVSALSNEPVYQDLFNLDDEHEIGHIRLSRESDLIVVAPATADLMAKMAAGLCNDLATNVLLATSAPVLVAPAMNPKMWQHRATQRNVAQLESDGIHFIGPAVGEMAEKGEAGPGRLVEVPELMAAIEGCLRTAAGDDALAGSPTLAGSHVLVTAGPTHEPIDPLRYIANRSSGRQGYAIAEAAALLGATVTLISGPTALADPPGMTVTRVETAAQMMAAVKDALPAQIAIFTAAVADWRVANPSGEKIKKGKGASAGKSSSGRSAAPKLDLVENPDILKSISTNKSARPALVIGFAAETDNLIDNARAKLRSKACDWIVANDVSTTDFEAQDSPANDRTGEARSGIPGGVMGGNRNKVHIVSAAGVEAWPEMTKAQTARRLMGKAAKHLRDRAVQQKQALRR